jgi:hypothetical protein
MAKTNFINENISSISLLAELESYGVNNNILYFLEIKDIISLIISSKTTSEMYLKMSLNSPVIIKIIKQKQLKRYISDQNRKTLLTNILKWFPKISELVIDDNKTMFEESFKEIYDCDSICESLKELKVVVGDNGLSGISKLTNLLTFDLFWPDKILNNTISGRLTDKGLVFLSKLIKLKSLSLTNCRYITDNGLISLSNLNNLISLKLSSCNLITDNGLNHLINFTNLISLDLSHTNNITDNGLTLLSNFINLTYLDLAYCYEITDIGLSYLSNLNNLIYLNLKVCHNITDNGLYHLLNL